MIHSQIVGAGGYIPERIVTNDYFEYLVENSDEWIFSRTGIRERRFVSDDQATSDLATIAARNAMKSAKVNADEIDCIVLATSTPDMCLPPSACLVQNNISAKNSFAFDMNAVCGGFVFAMEVADNLICSGRYKTIMVIGADTYSKILDFNDKNTCPLFGDGAGAVILQACKDPDKGILSSYIRSDGSGWPLIQVPSSGSRKPISAETIAQRENTFKMSGKQVYVFATEVIPEIITTLCEKAGVKPSDLTYIIPHQANIRMIDFIAKKFGYPEDRFLLNLQRCGNTAAASAALVLAENMGNGVVKSGDLALIMGFGGGLSWGGQLIRF